MTIRGQQRDKGNVSCLDQDTQQFFLTLPHAESLYLSRHISEISVVLHMAPLYAISLHR